MRKLYQSVSLILLISNSIYASAASFSIGGQVELEDSLATLQTKLKDNCKSQSLIKVTPPSYPLAEKSEVHLLCQNYQKDDVIFEKAIFVVADDQLQQMEASTVNIPDLTTKLGEVSGKYLSMQIFDKGRYWYHPQQKRFVWLAKPALHPNLFSWHNPYLTKTKDFHYQQNIQLPELLDFSKSIEDLKPLFEQHCPQIQLDQAKRIWLPNKPKSQTQINCFEYLYAGFPRKLEAVFGDGKLQVIWVLSGKAEESRLRNLLLEQFGRPSINNKNWEVFAGGRISLRKDKPELLILSDEMIPLYQHEFED